MNTFLSAALEYQARGWSVITLKPKDKRPIHEWAWAQKVAATSQDIKDMWAKTPQANVGIVTGAVSGIIVLDVDGDIGRQSVTGRHLPITPSVNTGKGHHYYLRHPGHSIANAVSLLPGVDVRGDGGYVVAPPSIHPSGRTYEWALPPNEPIASAPQWLIDNLTPQTPETSNETPAPRRHNNWESVFSTPAPENTRNNTITKISGYLLRLKGMDPKIAFYLVQCWNKIYCLPPLSDDEVYKTFNSIANKEADKREGVANG